MEGLNIERPIADTARTAAVNPAPAERFERKFFITPGKIDMAYAVLRQVCRPDAEFPENTVNSLYFDTPELDQYEKSAAGEFTKAKIRLRWYDKPVEGQTEVPVFLELKNRRGFASSKRRLRLQVPAQNIELTRLHTGVISKTLLINTLAGFGYFMDKPLRPVILICYRRHRFTEIMTGVRVSLDYNIRSRLAAGDLGHGEGEVKLAGGVIEIKGPDIELPITLRRMRILDTDWGRFSKYSSCLDSHLAMPDIVTQSWPAGRMPWQYITGRRSDLV